MGTNTPKEVYDIINQQTGIAVAGAVIPLPVADVSVILASQVTMILRIADYYGKTATAETARSFVLNLGVASLGMGLASFMKIFPFIGSISGGILQMSIAGSLTYLLGLSVDDIYRHDRSLTKENFEDVKHKYTDVAEKKGKDIAQQAKKQQKINEDINFRATQTKFKSQVTFKFDETSYEPEKIEIREPEKGTVVKHIEIKGKKRSYTWKPSSNIEKGHYIASLFVSDLLPISEKVIYE